MDIIKNFKSHLTVGGILGVAPAAFNSNPLRANARPSGELRVHLRSQSFWLLWPKI